MYCTSSASTDDYSSEGCYVDSQKNRIMSERMEEAYRMSAKVRNRIETSRDTTFLSRKHWRDRYEPNISVFEERGSMLALLS